jgi:rSAM/selenodomain-associated transferase 1
MIKRAEIIVVMAKEPTPGRVKTRLQSRFSAEEAAQLAAAALRDTQRAARAARIPRRVLCWDGDPSDFADGFDVLPQRAGNLNDRLTGAFDDLGRNDSARVMLIGMDTPQISSALLDADWENCDAVLGLSDDGGFWAIGLRISNPERVFAGIEMSTARTGSAQLARLLSLGLSVKLLPPLRDIDEPIDAAYVADRFPGLEFSQCYAALTLAGPQLGHTWRGLAAYGGLSE